MAVCPLCNGLQEVEKYCRTCHILLNDVGKVSDYLDPYGHYNDEETAKKSDGYPYTAADDVCPHLLTCNECGYDQVIFIQQR